LVLSWRVKWWADRRGALAWSIKQCGSVHIAVVWWGEGMK